MNGNTNEYICEGGHFGFFCFFLWTLVRRRLDFVSFDKRIINEFFPIVESSEVGVVFDRRP